MMHHFFKNNNINISNLVLALHKFAHKSHTDANDFKVVLSHRHHISDVFDLQ